MKKLFTILSRANNNSVGIHLFNHRRVSSVYSMLTLVAIMLMVPSAMKGSTVTTTINFEAAGQAAYQMAQNPGNGKYNAEIVMTDENYTAISNAKIGSVIHHKNGTTGPDIDISRLAFCVNTNGAGNANNTNTGYYLRWDRLANGTPSGLYTGSWNNKLAILGLKPGDKVRFYFAPSSNTNNAGIHYLQSVHCYGEGYEGNDAYYNSGAYFSNGMTVVITSLGDLIIEANQGTIIKSIEIISEIAEYTITTNGNTTTFEFTGNGSLEVNDFALPYLSASFGSTNDYLVVQNNKQAHMIKGDGTETLVTDQAQDWKPVAGSFYAFKPTGGGTITVEGGIQGSCVHLFVYNNGWEGANGNPYKETYNTDDDHYISFTFPVEKNKTYYICINDKDNNEHGNAFHLHKFSFTNTFHLEKLAKIVDLDKDVVNGSIQLTKIEGAEGLGDHPVKVKKCTGNIKPNSVIGTIDEYGYLNITKPEFEEGTDEAGTVILTIDTQGGDAAFVVTFPYHADYGYDEATGRSHGHIWNFIDPRLSDSNIGNSLTWDGYSTYSPGTTTGILSLGQYKTPGSDMRKETDNREWTYGWTIKSSGGDVTDPMYKNVWDMEGDNADMIWETEGLWFETGTNQSCIYNEKDAMDGLGQPTQYLQTMTSDPDRYVGLVPNVPNVTDTQNAPSFTIPGLKDGDRVLIYMKSGEKSGSDREAIFFNIEGALDAVGTPIVSTDLYGAGGTQYHVQRYEGCYHFIKDNSDTPMKFTMVRGAICKLLYIQIYSGKRIDTNHIERGGNSPLLFLNDEGTAQTDAAGGYYNMHYLGKGENIKAQVLAQSGNLTNNGLEAQNGTFSTDKFWYFKDSKTLRPANYNKRYVQFKSTVGEFGVFRLRLMDMDFIHDNGETTTSISNQGYRYVCDFADRNFTVGYREKMSYPYTWDFTDVNSWRNNGSNSDVQQENTKYPETTNKYERLGWDISFWDADGYMLIGNVHDGNNDGDIFSQNKEGFGNQLYANDKIIPETQGLWFYMDNNYPVYNRCAQITSEGLRFANTNLADGSHTPDWNYKMVVPDVPQNGAVYLRMKRDNTVKDADNTNGTPFLATKFHFGTTDDANQKTSLSTNTEVINGTGNSNSKYSFYKVSGSNDEYIVAVKNTGAMNHLTFTLNGWIVEKVAVSTDSKKLNIRGWATESRDHVIDPELTAYLTGKDIETCLVTGVDYVNKTITLQRVYSSTNTTNPSLVMSSLADGNKGASILHNTAVTSLSADDGEVNILDGGFHLFVPDMHDYGFDTENKYIGQKSITDNTSMLVAQVSNSNGVRVIPAWSNGFYTNYALTYKYRKLNADGTPYGSTITGDEAFYRIAAGGASSSGNQGYLPLLTEYVDPHSSSYGTNPTNTTNNAKFSIIFQEEFEVNSGIATQIENVESTGRVTTTEGFYNLNGQKINGIPTQKGMYIVNGKKVLVK